MRIGKGSTRNACSPAGVAEGALKHLEKLWGKSGILTPP